MSSAPDMSVDDASLIAACRAHGLKATPQRVAILRALRTSYEHPGPELLFAAVRKELPAISLGTVYKTLDALEVHGLVEEVTLKADSKRYDANLRPHHHLVCVRCKRIEDLVDDALLPRVPTAPQGFKVTFARVQMMGVCSACQKKRTKSASPPS